MFKKFMQLSLLAVVLAPTLSFSKTLLIVSSGLGMYGTEDGLNIAVEQFGANFIENALKNDYRKVYKFDTYQFGKGVTADKELIELLKVIVSERDGSERMDIFSMQHGPDGLPLDGLELKEVSGIIPHGFIKNVYSTSCSEFGQFKASNNGDLLITERNPEFSQNLQSLGVDNYLYHANDNATGVFTLPLLVNNIRKFNDWKVAAVKTYDQFDDIATLLIPSLSVLATESNLTKLAPTFVNPEMGWESLFNSRIIVGHYAAEKGLEKSMFTEVSEKKFVEDMIPMKDGLIKVLNEFCPGGMSPDMTCKSKDSKLPLTRVFSHILSVTNDLFQEYDPSSKGCIPGEVFSPFATLLQMKAEIKEVCFSKKNDGHFSLSWKLKTDGILKLRAAIKLDGIEGLRKITIARNGHITVKLDFEKGKSSLNVHGLKIFLNGIDGEGKLKGLTNFRFKGASIMDNGDVAGRVRFLIFPIAAGIESQDLEEITMPDFVKVFGIKVWKNKE